MPSDLWGKARKTSTNARLVVTSDAPLVSVKVGTSLVIDGVRVRVDAVEADGAKYTITAEAVSGE